jgi:hypothetical protein
MATLIWMGETSGDWDTVTNWIDEATGAASAAAPATGDTVIISAASTQDIDTSLGHDYDDVDITMIIEDGATISIGSAARPLWIGSTDASAWRFGGSGSYYLRIAGDTAAAGATLIIQGTGAGVYDIASYATEETFDSITVTNSSATLYLAVKPNEEAHTDAIYCRGTLYVGPDVDNTDANAGIPTIYSSGTGRLQSNAVNVYVDGGTFTHDVGTTVTNMYIYGGTAYANGTAITNLHVYGGGALDVSNRLGTCTIATIDLYDDATLNDPYGRIAASYTIDFNGTSTATATVNVGTGKTLTTAAVA